MYFKFKSLITYFIIFSILALPAYSFALTNGILATDLLGQYDQTSFTDPVPVYTKGGVNNGPNRFGFSGLEYNSLLDSTNHRFFVPDLGNNRVLVYNLNTDNTFPDRVPDYVLGQPDFYSYTEAVSQSSIYNVGGLAYDSANNRLFVAQSSGNRVSVFDLSNGITNGMNASYVLGQPDFTSSTATTTQSGMNSPRAVAYDSVNQRLFVAQAGANRVTVYDLADGITNGENAINVLGQANFTTSGSALTQSGFNSPRTLLYINNQLFVGDRNNNRVLVFDVTSITDGENAINVLGQANFTSSSSTTNQVTLSQNQGLAYDSVTQRLFVGVSGPNRVMVFNLADGITNGENAINVLGQTDFTTATSGTTQSKFNLSRGLWFDPTYNRLYVSDSNNNRIMIFDVSSITDGEPAVDLLGQYDQTSFTDPVPVYTKGGVNNGPNIFGFNQPQFSAIDTTNNRFFVSECSNNRILVFNLTSANLLTDKIPDYVLGQSNFYTNTASLTQSGVSCPEQIAFDSINNRLFVVNNGYNRITVYDTTTIVNGENAVNVLGQVDFTTSSSGATQSKFNNLWGVTLDSTNNRLFVADRNNNRVLVFDVTSITDGENAVNVLGQTDFTTSGSATTQSRMNSPRGLAFDSANQRLFVSENTNNRVLVFDVTSITDGENAVNVLGQADFITATAATTQAGMNAPQGVAYDSVNMRLFVSQTTGNRITVYDVSSITDGENAVNVIGQVNFTTSTAATTSAGLSTPRGVLYDSVYDKIYVTEEGNARVSIFYLTPPSITTTSTNKSGPLTVGDTITIYITFSNSVTVTGTPTLELETGDTDRLATYTSGSGTNTLSFTYTIQQGDTTTDLSYKSTSSLSLNGGTIIDSSNNNEATLTLPTPGASGSLSLTSSVAIVPPASVILPSSGGGASYTPTYVTTVTIPTTNPSVPSGPSACPTLPNTPNILKPNQTNETIKTLQQILNCKGYILSNTGPGSLNNETNYFGSLTLKALLKFQKDHNLKTDGIVGPLTRLKMGE